MAVTLREGLARAAFALALLAVASGRLLDDVIGPPFGAVLEVVAGMFVAIAAGIWATEPAPWKHRAGDLTALAVVAFTLLVHQLVDQEATAEFLRNGTLGLVFAAFVGGVTARAAQTPDTAHPVVGLAGAVGGAGAQAGGGEVDRDAGDAGGEVWGDRAGRGALRAGVAQVEGGAVGQHGAQVRERALAGL